MTLATVAAEVYRDFTTPGGVPHKPQKPEVRDLWSRASSAMSGLALAGIVSVKYAALASLNADLSHDADTLAIVYDDGPNSGIYYKIGAYGSGSWALSDIALPATFASDIALILAAANDLNTAVAAAEASADAAEAASEASGAVEFYDTKAAANAAVAGLPDLQVVEVFVDESQGSDRTRYRKESGSLVFKVNLSALRRNLSNVSASSAQGAAFLDAIQANAANVLYEGRALSARLGDAVSVMDYGADNTGAGDTYAEIAATIAAVDAAGGGYVDLPAGTFLSSNKFVLPYKVRMRGAGMTATIIRFTAATHGIEVNDTFNLGQGCEDLCLQTAHADCTKAINIPTYMSGSAHLMFRNVLVNSADPDLYRWDYGIDMENCQVSVFDNVLINYGTKTGMRMRYACNANVYRGCEVVGYTADSEYAVVQHYTGSGGGSLTFEDYWFGCVLQGAFDKAIVSATSASPKHFGTHFENTDGAPSDGADIVLAGGIVNASFMGCEGGSLTASGTIRNLNIHGGQMNDVTVGSGVELIMLGLRYGTLTADAAAYVTAIGTTTTSGTARANPVRDLVAYQSSIPRITSNSATPTLPDADAFIIAYTVATDITSLVGGREGQRITVNVQANATLKDGGNMRLAGDLVGAGNTVAQLVLMEGVWYEVSRSAN